MSITGIITEYNPFHNGHLHHIQETRKRIHCDVLIAVMSGNFVQRGEAAIVDKWKRSAYAIQNGVDLVIELPFPYVVQSSDHFAYGAVTSLALAGVDDLVFGSECNDITLLKKRMQMLDQDAIQATYKKGHALPYAYGEQMALQSNDILAIAYLKAIENTTIKAHTIQRTNQYHDTSLMAPIASASAIRKGIYHKEDVSHTTCMHQELDDTYAMEHYYPLIQTLLTTLPATYLKNLFLMDEGIENRFIEMAKQSTSYQAFVNACCSKRYTKSRIQRTLIHMLVQTSKKEMNTLPNLQHIHVLGFNDIGRAHLQTLRDHDVIIANRFNRIPKAYRDLLLRSTAVFTYPLSIQKRNAIVKMEYQFPLYIRS